MRNNYFRSRHWKLIECLRTYWTFCIETIAYPKFSDLLNKALICHQGLLWQSTYNCLAELVTNLYILRPWRLTTVPNLLLKTTYWSLKLKIRTYHIQYTSPVLLTNRFHYAHPKIYKRPKGTRSLLLIWKNWKKNGKETPLKHIKN